MSDNTHLSKLYALILAGGKGRRLWPESQESLPKQFIDFFGAGQTLLQQTYARFRRFLPPERILVSTNIAYKTLVKNQLPDIADENILSEPIYRNTGPSTAWGAYRIYCRDEQALAIISPADQHIVNTDAFAQDILNGAAFVAENNRLLTLGVKPTRPEPGYGYIQFDKEIGNGIYTVRSFTEKPDREFAQLFIDSGEFLWNTGLLLANARCLLDSIAETLPSLFKKIKSLGKNHSIDDENRYVLEHFPRYPNLSVEEGILEKTTSNAVMKCNFGWADLGTWHGIYEALNRNNSGENVVLDSDVILDNAHNNIIKIPHGHLAVINGLDGFIVVEKGETLLICPKEDSSALIRKYSAEVEIR